MCSEKTARVIDRNCAIATGQFGINVSVRVAVHRATAHQQSNRY
jgi:hypothetical protein